MGILADLGSDLFESSKFSTFSLDLLLLILNNNRVVILK